MTETEQLETDIRFGAEVEQFLKSNVGRYLLARSKQEIDAAMEKLKDVDPCNSKEIREIQTGIKRNENIEAWLADTIQAAWDARDIIEHMD